MYLFGTHVNAPGQGLAVDGVGVVRKTEQAMVEWLRRLVVGEGNVVRERSYTNWNTLDVSEILAEKEREVSCGPADETPPSPQEPASAEQKK